MPDSIRVASTAVRVWRFARGRLPFLLFLGLVAGVASGAGELRWPPVGVPVDDLVSPVLGYASGSKPWPDLIGKSNVREERPIERLIVKYHDEDARSFSLMTGLNRLGALAERSPVALYYDRPMSGAAHVIALERPLPRAEAIALSRRLALDPAVEYVSIDDWVEPYWVPNDPYYSLQWHYHPAASVPGGIDATGAWDIARGQGVIVAVLDTGIAYHPDLAGNVLPGYDFVSDIDTANDGDGRDPDASDPGDWVSAGMCEPDSEAESSSWHGTHVAGTIGIVTNNGSGLAGVAHQAQILPVRVLGRCGGSGSDVADGIRWAAGLPVSGVPNNPTPARVINLSLGSLDPCGPTYQSAIADARAAGAVVVAATGNEGMTSIGTPANCPGVIAVTAHTFQADSADYASVGAGTTLSAPGGGSCTTPDSGGFSCLPPGDELYVWSVSLFGATTPDSSDGTGHSGPAIGGGAGTSMAAPHVAGAAALLLSKMPTLSPDDVAGLLTNAARPFPSGLYCAQNPGLCGAGLLDARAALDLLDGGGPSLSVSHPSLIAGGQTASLIATATPGSGGSTSFAWQWTQIAGTPVTLMGANTAVASFVGPNPGGSHTIKVTVVDGNGYSASQTVSVRTNNPPVMNPVAPKSVAQGGSLYFTVSATDPENDPLVYVAVTNPPSGASFSAATGAFSWPNVGVAPGNYSFKVMAYDGTVDSAQLTIDITVTNSASPPPTGGGGGASELFNQLLSLLLAVLAALWNALGGN